MIRKDKWITGQRIPASGGQDLKCVLYMDDINIVCTDMSSINRAFILTEQYEKASGAKLNENKTQLQLYGPWTASERTQAKVNSNEQKILGIKFDKEGKGEVNWTEISAKVRQRTGLWKQRDLTLNGKVLIIKAVIIPLFLLAASVFLPSRKTIRSLERTIFQFLWGSKWERLKREEMKKPKGKGGMGVPDLYLCLGAHYTCTHMRQARSDPIPVAGLAGGEAVWKGISRPGLPNRLMDLSWQVAHGILPVRDVMHSRGMAAKAACPRSGCGAPETVRHLLWECSAAIDLWTTAGSQDFPYLPAREVLTAHLVLYGVSQSMAKPEKLIDEERLTLAAIKDAIWTSRNLLVRKHMQIPPVAVIRMAAALRSLSGLRAASQGHSHKEESPL
nr:uncharacterized protein LOC129164570 isoform X1 [Nothobranchius furzeri]